MTAPSFQNFVGFARPLAALGALLLTTTLLACSSDEDETTDGAAAAGSAGAPSGGTGGSAGAGASSAGSSGAGQAAGGAAGTTGQGGASGTAGSAGETTGTGGTAGTAGTTGTSGIGPAPVLLGSAGQYVILAKSAISNVPISAVTGDVGLSPAAASYITGFAMTKVGAFWTSPEVTGNIYAADNDPATPSNLTTAVSDMETAYTDAAGRPTPTFLDLGSGGIGGLTLTPGLYKWNSTVTIPTGVTLAGGPDDTWIFQITGDLSMSTAQAMTLSGGAKARNIVWQVAGSVDLGTAAHAEGIILSMTAITLGTGASINGRLLAQTAVNIEGATVTAPAP